MKRGALVLLLWLAAMTALVRAQGVQQPAIALSMPSVVLVIGVDVSGGELVAMAAGSGTIFSDDGAVLTNHHILYDAREGRLHDLFLVGRFRAAGREPDVMCAGVPGHGELRPALDLAIIRCDKDLDGQPFGPENWPALPLGDSQGIVPGEQVWVLGYPGAGGGSILVSAGLVSGWTGEEGGTASRAFMRTDAAITGGNSGGAALDRHGRLIGVPTAFRVVSAERGEHVTAVGKVGLIRPIEAARELLEVVLGPASDKASAVLVSGTVSSAGSGKPVAGAFVMALPAGTSARDLDGADTGELVLAWSTTDASGAFTLAPPLPRGASYTIAVTAAGYAPALERDALHLPDEGAHRLVPWREIRLLPRTGSE